MVRTRNPVDLVATAGDPGLVTRWSMAMPGSRCPPSATWAGAANRRQRPRPPGPPPRPGGGPELRMVVGGVEITDQQPVAGPLRQPGQAEGRSAIGPPGCPPAAGCGRWSVQGRLWHRRASSGREPDRRHPERRVRQHTHRLQGWLEYTALPAPSSVGWLIRWGSSASRPSAARRSCRPWSVPGWRGAPPSFSRTSRTMVAGVRLAELRIDAHHRSAPPWPAAAAPQATPPALRQRRGRAGNVQGKEPEKLARQECCRHQLQPPPAPEQCQDQGHARQGPPATA